MHQVWCHLYSLSLSVAATWPWPNFATTVVLQRLVLLTVVAAVAVSFLSQQVSGMFIDEDCPGMMGNRDIYEKVVWVCDDCANIFRNNDVGQRCRYVRCQCPRYRYVGTAPSDGTSAESIIKSDCSHPRLNPDVSRLYYMKAFSSVPIYVAVK